jgi:Co/Zn/Cd efflux system component
MYIIALCILGLNAYLAWLDSSSFLGIIGLITNFVYDIFIFAFTALKSSGRSLRNIFLLVFIGRLLSFVFGTTLWIFGYCILYLIVGLFIGRIIVNTRFPLKKKPKTKAERHRYAEQNALKTP